MEMSRLTRDRTDETVSRDQILRHERGPGNIHFPCSAGHEQDWQPHPVDQHSAIIVVVVVVVVDSYIQHISLATEKTAVTQQVSHIPIKCQSRLWSQGGTKANGPHHGDKLLLRQTGIQIATKSYATPQVMAPTNVKTVHQTSLLHIESNLDRLGLLSATHDQRSQQQSKQTTLQLVLVNTSNFIKATHRTKIRKIEIPRPMVVKTLSW